MHLRIVEYADQWSEALAAFNARLDAAGNPFRLPPPPDLHVSPSAVQSELLQKQYLVLDEGGNVRGGYVLKFQDFWLAGEVTTIADFRLPVSEAIINRSYAQVAVGLLVNVQKQQPMLYGLGMGGFNEPIARLLKAAGWGMFSVPFYFQIIRPFHFFRNIVHLRKSAAALRGVRFSGLFRPGVAVRRGHAGPSPSSRSGGRVGSGGSRRGLRSLGGRCLGSGQGALRTLFRARRRHAAENVSPAACQLRAAETFSARPADRLVPAHEHGIVRPCLFR